MKKARLFVVAKNVRLAAGAFFSYGVFAGLIVPKHAYFPSSLLNYTLFLETVGVPVQVFRTLCAIVVTYSMIRVLNIFDWETKGTLRQARDELEIRVNTRTKELAETNEVLRTEISEHIEAEEKIKESEQKYRDLFENANDLIQSVNSDGKFIYVNKKWLGVLGYSKEEVMGLTFADILHPDQIPHCMDIFKDLVGGKTVDQLETIFVSKNGEEVHVQGNLNSQIKDGKFIATRGIFRDISEKKKAENFIINILESVGEGFVVVDREYRIVTANKAYCHQVDMPLEQMIGKHCYEVSHRRQKPCHEAGEECAVKYTFETGVPASVVHTHRDRDGNPVYVEVKSYPMKDKSGKIVSIIENIIDITEKIKLEEQLLQAQKMDAVGQLAGGIAHDFNNLLTAIIGFGSLLEMDLSGHPEHMENVGQILSSADKAARLTQSLLAFSRKKPVELKPLDLHEIVDHVEVILGRLIGEDIKLDIVRADEALTIVADSTQIEQVLMNLATNARDSMPGGGVLKIQTEKVDVDTAFIKKYGFGEFGSYAVLSMSDTGQGMDKKTKERIFDPFFTTKEMGKGTGLGLAIVYGIVKQHRGYIHVSSDMDKGTTVSIYLPTTSAHAERRPAGSQSSSMGGTETVLVAEDNDDVRRLMIKVLEGAGYKVVAAVDGDEALEKFEQHKDDIRLLILDVVMPNKNGQMVYNNIRENHDGIQTLFMSGYTADIIDTKGIMEQGSSFLSKPIMPNEFLIKVRELLDRMRKEAS
jgi:two-component system NtrC family sensor kinase